MFFGSYELLRFDKYWMFSLWFVVNYEMVILYEILLGCFGF